MSSAGLKELLADPSVPPNLPRLIRGLALTQQFQFSLIMAAPPVIDVVLSGLPEAVAAVRGDPQHPLRLVRLDPYLGHEASLIGTSTLRKKILAYLVDPPPEDVSPDVIVAIDASAAEAPDDWVWIWLFELMNERRNVIAQRLGGSLLLCLPERLEPAFAHAAPDFWSIRSSAVLLSDLSQVSAPARREEPFHEGLGFEWLWVEPSLLRRRSQTLLVVSELGLSTSAGDTTRAFVDFLRWARKQQPIASDLHLVLAGNTVDFLTDPNPPASELAMALLARILSANEPVLAALADHVARGGELTLLLGSNDLELSLPELRELFLQRLGPGRVRFLDDGQAFDHGFVLIEHGSRYDPWHRVDHDTLRRVRCSVSRWEQHNWREWPPWGVPKSVRLEWEEPPPMPESLITPGRALLLRLVLPLKERYPFLPFLMPRLEAALPLLRLLEPVRFSKWQWRRNWQRHHDALGRGPSAELEDLLHEAQHLAEEDPSEQGLMLALRGGVEQRRRQLTRLARALQPLLAAHRYDRSPLMEEAKYLGAADRLARNEFDLIVFGHTHRAKQIRLKSGRTYLNCGAWRRMPRLPLPDPDLDEAHLPEMLDEFIALLVEGDLDRWGYDPPTFARIEFGENHSLTGVYRFEGPDRVTPLLGR